MVANEVISYLATAISAVSGWFIDIMQATELIPFYLCMMLVGLVVFYLLEPILPNRGSDSAKRKDEG